MKRENRSRFMVPRHRGDTVPRLVRKWGHWQNDPHDTAGGGIPTPRLRHESTIPFCVEEYLQGLLCDVKRKGKKSPSH